MLNSGNSLQEEARNIDQAFAEKQDAHFAGNALNDILELEVDSVGVSSNQPLVRSKKELLEAESHHGFGANDF